MSLIDEYLAAVAGQEAAPGGGSVAAAAGAMGAALVAMACRLTLGRPRFVAVQAEVSQILARAELFRAELTRLADDDAAAYTAVMAAYRLPKQTAPQKAQRQTAIQSALKQATQTPLATAGACGQVLSLSRQAATLVNPNARGDVNTAQLVAAAGLQAAAQSVLINLNLIKDQGFVIEQQAAIEELLTAHNCAAAVRRLLV